jgi:DNA-binding transcriptional MerR regulator
MYQIGMFSKMTRTTIKQLRYYEMVGLLKPAKIDEFTNYRYYTTDQMYQLYDILAYRQIGLSIKQIQDIIIYNKTVEDVISIKRKELLFIQNETKKRLSQIDYLLKEKKEGFIMEYKVIEKELPECIVFAKELVVNDFNSYFELFPAIGEEVRKANPTLKCLEPDYCFVKYLDNEYKEKDIHIEYCQAVNEIGVEVDGVKFKKIDSIKAVCVVHKGTYSGVRDAYAYLLKWIEGNGYEIADAPREFYIDGIWNKEDENDWLTEVQIPIK